VAVPSAPLQPHVRLNPARPTSVPVHIAARRRATSRRLGRMAKSTTLRTPLGRSVKIIEQGTGTPVVFLHSGVGSAGEWKQVFSLWPDGDRLIAIDAYRDGTGP